ncbi:MAG: hypothetical protein KOO66_12940 [Bacteroidales bacterium]|nr:hypothetical protein [Bacteroidales bacterium]
MIDINRNNYEKYFLDFTEGKLLPFEESLLMSFLKSNPDLKEELDLLTDIPKLKSNTAFRGKEVLRKSLTVSDNTSNNFDELCIARIEGDLNEKEIVEFDSLINDHEKSEREFNLYKLTKITADETIDFSYKNRLKKKTTGSFVFKNRYSVISAAASIVIAVAVYNFLPKNQIGETIPAEKIAYIDDVESNETKTEINRNISEEVTESVIVNKANSNRLINVDKNDNIVENSASNNPELIREYNQLAKLYPVEIEMEFKSTVKKLAFINPVEYNYPEKKSQENNSQYISVKSFLAETFNKRVLKKENKDRLELFDFAQAGVEGINKITGSNMTLQRIYDENGMPDKTEFNSRLIAFSSPAKKDQNEL